jgi:ABC-2 type transport system permease protein
MGPDSGAPIRRGALSTGTVLYAVLMVLIQTGLIVLLALALGADYTDGLGGVLLLILIAALLGAAFASLSKRRRRPRAPARDADRRRQPRSAAAQVPLDPRHATKPRPRLDLHRREVQPRQLDSRGRRSAAMQRTDWRLVASGIGLLVALTPTCAIVATSAVTNSRRSL